MRCDVCGLDPCQTIGACAWEHPGWKKAAVEYAADRARLKTTTKIPVRPVQPATDKSGACTICRLNPCETEGFCRACREADARHEPRPDELPQYWETMDVPPLWEALNHPDRWPDAPTSAYDTVVWSLIYHDGWNKERKGKNKRLIAQFSPLQLHNLIAALKRKNCDPDMIAEIESYA